MHCRVRLIHLHITRMPHAATHCLCRGIVIGIHDLCFTQCISVSGWWTSTSHARYLHQPPGTRSGRLKRKTEYSTVKSNLFIEYHFLDTSCQTTDLHEQWILIFILYCWYYTYMTSVYSYPSGDADSSRAPASYRLSRGPWMPIVVLFIVSATLMIHQFLLFYIKILYVWS